MNRGLAWIVLISAVGVLGFAGSANAQLANPDFNNGLSGWGVLSCGGSAAFWSPNDVFPWVTTSGSANLVGLTRQNNDHTCLYLYSNVSLLPVVGTNYAFGGIVSVDQTAVGKGDVRFGVNWMSSPGSCMNNNPYSIRIDYSEPIPEGTRWKVSWTTVTPPSGATAYCLFMWGGKDYEPFSAHLDKAFIIPLP